MSTYSVPFDVDMDEVWAEVARLYGRELLEDAEASICFALETWPEP